MTLDPDQYHCSMQQIADELGCSSALVSKIERKALLKLLKFCDKQGINIEDWMTPRFKSDDKAPLNVLSE